MVGGDFAEAASVGEGQPGAGDDQVSLGRDGQAHALQPQGIAQTGQRPRQVLAGTLSGPCAQDLSGLWVHDDRAHGGRPDVQSCGFPAGLSHIRQSVSVLR